MDSNPDVGGLSGFDNVKTAPDTVYTTLTEALIDGATSYDYVDVSTSNVDGVSRQR